MPVLPLIDLMLLSGWTALFAGFVLKAVALTTTYRPTIFGMSSSDFFMIAMAALLFAIALAARTWVKTQEPGVTAERRRKETLDAWKALPGNGERDKEQAAEELFGTAAASASNQANRG